MSENLTDQDYDRIWATLDGSAVDLLKIDTSEPRPWMPGSRGWLRAGERVLLFGPRGEGKTEAAVIAALDVVAAGGTVLYLDFWENGADRMAERVQTVLADRPVALAELLGTPAWEYRENLNLGLLNEHPEVLQNWQESVRETADLVVWDSLPHSFGHLGINEESNPQVQQFIAKFIDPLVEGGYTTVVALDNTGWSETGRSRGASSKWDLFQLVYEVSGGQTCSPTQHGQIKLKRRRWRDGDEATELVVGAGGGHYTPVLPAEDALLVGMLGVLPLKSKNAIHMALRERGTGLNKAALLAAVDRYVAEGKITVGADGMYQAA